VTGHPLNNLAHYVLYRAMRHALQDELGANRCDELMQRGGSVPLERILDDHGLSIGPPRPHR
jgi:hypothetical protein